MNRAQVTFAIILFATLPSSTSLYAADAVASAPEPAVSNTVSKTPKQNPVNLQAYANEQGNNSLLPQDTVYLRNNSNVQVIVYALNLSRSGLWEKAYMRARQEVLIASDSLWLAVATAESPSPVDIDRLRPETLTNEPIEWNAYWVALLRQGHRYELCWNTSANKWRTGEIKKHAC